MKQEASMNQSYHVRPRAQAHAQDTRNSLWVIGFAIAMLLATATAILALT